MDQSEILAHLDEERRGLVRDGEVLESRPGTTRLRAADGSNCAISYSALNAEIADSAIAREIEHHRRLAAPFEWKLYSHDGPVDLLDRLQRHGFEIGPMEAVLVYDLAHPAEWITRNDANVVQRIDRIADVEVFRKVAEQVFQKNYAFTASQLSTAVTAGSTQHRGYIAYAADHPASIGRLYTHPKSRFGGLYGGGTLPAFRGHGLYRAVVAARARDAIAFGARYLIVDALPTSRPILERLGFVWVADTWPCEWRS